MRQYQLRSTRRRTGQDDGIVTNWDSLKIPQHIHLQVGPADLPGMVENVLEAEDGGLERAGIRKDRDGKRSGHLADLTQTLSFTPIEPARAQH